MKRLFQFQWLTPLRGHTALLLIVSHYLAFRAGIWSATHKVGDLIALLLYFGLLGLLAVGAFQGLRDSRKRLKEINELIAAGGVPSAASRKV